MVVNTIVKAVPMRQIRRAMYTAGERMFRTPARLILSVLLVTALLWGGCVACPQYFQAPFAKQSCCTPTGQCKNTKTGTPQQKTCQFQQVELQPTLRVVVPAIAIALPVSHIAITFSALPPWSHAAEIRLGDLPESPQGKQALLSTFLI
jgi:hypothetical protein